MPYEIDICLICLHTDIMLKVIDHRLSDFYEELCDYSYYSFGEGDPKLCTVCEHLLRKLYNFKEKCVLAINLLQKWKNHKVENKRPLNVLFTLLPESGLGTWKPNNSKIIHFEGQPKPVSHSSTPSTEPVLKINVLRPSVPSASETQPPTTCERPIEKPIPIKDIKLEINCEDDAQVLNLENDLKTEETTIPYIENLSEHNINSKKMKSECLEENDIQLLIKDDTDTEIVEYLDDTILNDDDTETDSNLDFTPFEKTVSFKDIKTVSIENRKYILIKVNKRRSTKNKKSLDNQTNASLSDDDFINRDEAEIKTDEAYVTEDDKNEEQDTANKIITDLKNMNAELDSMNDNYEKIMLQSGNVIQKNKKYDIIKKNNKYSLKNKEGLEKMFLAINKDMKDIQENCKNIIHPEDGPSSIHKRIKALKEYLTARFESCGELKSTDGVAIDKEHMLNCIDGRASSYLLNILWKAVNGKKKLNQKAVKILALIQQKYNKSKYESVFDIEYMNTPEAMKEEMQKRQTYPWYIKAKHKCELCYIVFKYEKQLENHKKTHDENAGDFTCPICGVRHKQKTKHLRHLTIHEIVYKCKLCPLVTYYKQSMIHHYDQHQGMKYRCEPCNKNFGSNSGLNTHRGYAHQRDHVCTTCGRTFETEEILNTHKKSHRVPLSTDSSTSVKCDACELTFPSQQVYERHARFTHGAPQPWGLSRTNIIGRPRNKHAAQNKPRIMKKVIYTCPQCKAVGHSFSWLVLHGRLEHGTDLNALYAHKRTHLCDVCGKGFTNTNILRVHMYRHTGVRPYQCESCPKRFTSSYCLQNHRLYHLPPSQLCNQCGKKFHTLSNLYSHMQTHIRDRRYKCNICGKGFILASMVREHIRGVHNKVRRVRKRGATEVAEGASEPGGSGGAGARSARTSTVARTKRQKMKEVESTDESSDSD